MWHISLPSPTGYRVRRFTLRAAISTLTGSVARNVATISRTGPPSAHRASADLSEAWKRFTKSVRELARAGKQVSCIPSPIDDTSASSTSTALPSSSEGTDWMVADLKLLQQLGVTDMQAIWQSSSQASRAETTSESSSPSDEDKSVQHSRLRQLAELACNAGIKAHVPPEVILHRLNVAVNGDSAPAVPTVPLRAYLGSVSFSALLVYAAKRLAWRRRRAREVKGADTRSIASSRSSSSGRCIDHGKDVFQIFCEITDIRAAYKLWETLGPMVQVTEPREVEAALLLLQALQDSDRAQHLLCVYLDHVEARYSSCGEAGPFDEPAAAEKTLRCCLLAMDIMAASAQYNASFSIMQRFLAKHVQQHDSPAEWQAVLAKHFTVSIQFIAPLARAVGVNAIHYENTHSMLLGLFRDSDVGYESGTREHARDGLCAVLSALASANLGNESRAEHAERLMKFAVQHSHPTVYNDDNVLQQALRVQCAACHPAHATAMFNQLLSPKTRTKAMREDILGAMLLCSESGQDDFLRYLNYQSQHFPVTADMSHALVAKLLLEGRTGASTAAYFLLDGWTDRPGGDVFAGQNFFLRCLTLYNDLRRRMEKSDLPAVADALLRSDHVLQSWLQDLEKALIKTLPLATLQLLQEIYATVTDILQRGRDINPSTSTPPIVGLLQATLEGMSRGYFTSSIIPGMDCAPRRLSAEEVQALQKPQSPASAPFTVVALHSRCFSLVDCAAQRSPREVATQMDVIWAALLTPPATGSSFLLSFRHYALLCDVERYLSSRGERLSPPELMKAAKGDRCQLTVVDALGEVYLPTHDHLRDIGYDVVGLEQLSRVQLTESASCIGLKGCIIRTWLHRWCQTQLWRPPGVSSFFEHTVQRWIEGGLLDGNCASGMPQDGDEHRSPLADLFISVAPADRVGRQLAK